MVNFEETIGEIPFYIIRSFIQFREKPYLFITSLSEQNVQSMPTFVQKVMWVSSTSYRLLALSGNRP